MRPPGSPGGTILILLDQGNSSRRIEAENRHRDISSSRSTLVLTRGPAEPRALPVRAAGMGGTGLAAGRSGATAFTGAAAAWAFSSSWSTFVLTELTDWPTLVGTGRGIVVGLAGPFGPATTGRGAPAAPTTLNRMPVGVDWTT